MHARASLPTLSSLLLCLLLLTVPASPASAQEDGASLYQRMGGYDVVAAVVDDFFARMGEDPLLAPLLAGVASEEAGRVRQHFVDFFCQHAGGPCVYHGRDMGSAHAGLAIGDRHFEATMGHLADALEAQGVGRAEQEEVLGMVRPFKDAIVQR